MIAYSWSSCVVLALHRVGLQISSDMLLVSADTVYSFYIYCRVVLTTYWQFRHIVELTIM